MNDSLSESDSFSMESHRHINGISLTNHWDLIDVSIISHWQSIEMSSGYQWILIVIPMERCRRTNGMSIAFPWIAWSKCVKRSERSYDLLEKESNFFKREVWALSKKGSRWKVPHLLPSTLWHPLQQRIWATGGILIVTPVTLPSSSYAPSRLDFSDNNGAKMKC